MLQTSIGNLAMLRLLGQRITCLKGKEPYGDNEQEAPPLPGALQPKLVVGQANDPPENKDPIAEQVMHSQTKLAMSQVDDPSEQGADRVAEKIVRTPEHSTLLNKPVESTHAWSWPVLARQSPNDARPLDAGTALAEREREVEAINVGGTNYVLYQTKVRGGGSSSWLANNPGNLDYTADTVAWGCYEDKALIWGKHRFAIFQDESTGLAAVRGFLRKYQTIRDITLMMNLFAPASDWKNNPTQYSEKVAKRIGPPVTVHTLVKDLTDDQIRLFAEAIKDAEGWKPGPVNDVPRGDPSLPESVRNR